MSGAASSASFLARRAAQKERVRLLYRRALRDTLNWAVHRHLFYEDEFYSEDVGLIWNLVTGERLKREDCSFSGERGEGSISWMATRDSLSLSEHSKQETQFLSFSASRLRERFDANKHVEDLTTIERLIEDGEAAYEKWRHPDPYIVPWAPGGSKFTRNPPPPEGIEIVYDYGRE